MQLIFAIFFMGVLLGSFMAVAFIWVKLLSLIGVRFNYLNNPIYKSKRQRVAANLIFLLCFSTWIAAVMFFIK